ncbi:heavy-metal-associated domain-containing protein [Mesobacillus harenae]|uniref:heavy-metal-associated domain-containing protein n=1 Tax=Mesobacillus harenae TaxID=2213203 RepID=UPI001580CD06|nr:cation transporter [Mesobacillus harenae]
MITRTITISEMSKADEEKINEALHDVWGVRNIKLNPTKGEAVISFDEQAASFIDFKQAVIDCGFQITETGEQSS